MAGTLIIGGVKSGKSNYGEALLTDTASRYSNLFYLAASLPLGDELKNRIESHKNQRDSRFVTHELVYHFSEKYEHKGSNICSVLSKLQGSETNGILIECMATWLGGMLSFCDDLKLALTLYYKEREHLLQLIAHSQANIVVISNEVGMGLIGSSQLERCYIDEMGLLNQELGTVCEQVIQVSAGFPLYLKGR